MSKKEKEEPYVTICPKCGSDNVKAETNPAYAVTGLLTAFSECGDCGHHGQVFPQVPLSKLPKKLKPVEKIPARQLVQTSYGKAYSKLLKYYLIPFTVAVIAIYLLLQFI